MRLCRSLGGSISLLLAVVACVALLAVPNALAEPPPQPAVARNWTFTVAPYIWLPAMTGSAAVDGRSVDIDTSVGDLFTETDFIFAVQADFEAWYKHRVGMIFNGQWTVLEQNDNTLGPEDGPPFNLPGGPGGPGIFPFEFDLKNNIGLFEFLGAFQLGSWEWGQGAFSTTFTFEPLAGIRVTYMKVTLDPKGGFSKVKESRTWVDPILGARMSFAFGADRRWIFRVRGDYGGFGAGSEFTWNVAGMFGYELRFKTFDLEATLGLRALSQDYVDNSGGKRFEWDVIQWGPLFALAFKF